VTYRKSHLDQLESEGIYVMREVAAQFERPVLLFSGGKDSIVMVHLAMKAFWPAPIPFPLMHVDTGHNFPETIDFRDRLVERLGAELVVGSVQESIDRGKVVEETGPDASRNALQTVTLLDTLKGYRADAALGGGRRDEEKARAKERFFSHRDAFGQWNPKNQRPELWNLFNGRKNVGEHFRVFPISNWTELDVWQYIARERIELPELYFSHEREVVRRNGTSSSPTPSSCPHRGRDPGAEAHPLPHHRRRHLHRRHRVGRRQHRRHHPRGGHAQDRRAGRALGRPAVGGGDGGQEEGGLFLAPPSMSSRGAERRGIWLREAGDCGLGTITAAWSGPRLDPSLRSG
jgi:sulfate adenylyltransferase subunit 2